MKLSSSARLCFCFLALLWALALPRYLAAQQPALPAPDFLGLTQALIRFGAVDIELDTVVDEYALLKHCDLFTQHFADDFTWNRIREVIREEIKRDLPTTQTAFALTAVRQLGRYDFEKQQYPLDETTPLKAINAVVLVEKPEKICENRQLTILPTAYRALLDFAFTVEGIPMGKEDARLLLARMNSVNNLNREVYLRINVRLTFADPIRLEGNQKGPGRYSFDGRLESVDFYEDKAFSKLLFSYAP